MDLKRLLKSKGGMLSRSSGKVTARFTRKRGLAKALKKLEIKGVHPDSYDVKETGVVHQVTVHNKPRMTIVREF